MLYSECHKSQPWLQLNMKKREGILEFNSNLSIDLSHDLTDFKNTKYKKKAQHSQTSTESEISLRDINC